MHFLFTPDRTIRKESVFFVLILDFFYCLFLLMGYRLNVEFVLSYQSLDGPANYSEYSFISYSTMGIAGYFLFKVKSSVHPLIVWHVFTSSSG